MESPMEGGYWEKEYEELSEETDFPLVALDLATTSLRPLIAHLAWYAQQKSNKRGGF